VEVATGVVFLSDPLLFGPSGIAFIEPGVEIEFVADPASLVIPSDKQIFAYKVFETSLSFKFAGPIALCGILGFNVIEFNNKVTDSASTPNTYHSLISQIVNGKMERHVFDPHVDVVTGKIAVKTLSFSAYVVASGPIPEPVKPTRPKANTSVDLPDQAAGPDQVRDMLDQNDAGHSNYSLSFLRRSGPEH
jgi:hypothetical protein